MFFIRRNKQYNEAQPADMIGAPAQPTMTESPTAEAASVGSTPMGEAPAESSLPAMEEHTTDGVTLGLGPKDPLAAPTETSITPEPTMTPSPSEVTPPGAAGMSIAEAAGVPNEAAPVPPSSEVDAPDLTNPMPTADAMTPLSTESTMNTSETSPMDASAPITTDTPSVALNESAADTASTTPTEVPNITTDEGNQPTTEGSSVITDGVSASTGTLQVVEDTPLETPATTTPEVTNNSEFTEAQMAKITDLAEAAAEKKLKELLSKVAA